MSLDLAHAYIPAAHKVLHGVSPYPPADFFAALAPHDAFVYPPLTAWLVVPFTVLPIHVAEAVGFALGIGAVAGLLWLMGVRDWRCYMIAYLWVPTYSAIQIANVTLILAVGLAALWRYRSRPVVSGIRWDCSSRSSCTCGRSGSGSWRPDATASPQPRRSPARCWWSSP